MPKIFPPWEGTLNPISHPNPNAPPPSVRAAPLLVGGGNNIAFEEWEMADRYNPNTRFKKTNFGYFC